MCLHIYVSTQVLFILFYIYFLIIFQKCADYDVSNKVEFPTFARTFPPATQVAKPIISLLLHFKWTKFTLIMGSLYKFSVIAEKIRELADEHDITINEEEVFKEPHLPLTTGNPFPGIVERTFVDTRGKAVYARLYIHISHSVCMMLFQQNCHG